MKNKAWIEELDYIRGLAFLAVVMQHSLGVFIRYPVCTLQEQMTLGIIFNLVKFSVPAFMFISGLVMVYNYSQGIKPLNFYQKRWKEIFIPYLLWSLIYSTYYNWNSLDRVYEGKSFVYNLLTGSASYHLWFVVLIMQWYFVFPLLVSFFRWMGERKTRILGAVLWGAIVYTVIVWWSYRIAPCMTAKQPGWWLQLVKFRDRNLIMWFFYFLTGGAVAYMLPGWRTCLKKRAIFVFMGWAVLLVIVTGELFNTLAGSRVNLNISTSLKPSMFVYTVFSLALVYMAGLRFAAAQVSWYSKLLKYVGRYSLGAYFVHALGLVVAVRCMMFLWPSFAQMLLLATGTAFLLSSALSVLFTHVVSRLPYGRWLTGTVR
ncbi:acyltransferase [Desulfurispora thermophila]|uniref:acyltransferase n=1 Tax=Desulfurispora thermophila TaxID=265470 RepID=UPI000365F23F|nr:acyltransferase [Desulfurispora thermophila]